MNENKAACLKKKIEDEHGNIAGMVILKKGKTLFESYFNGCTAQSAIHVFSVTKSIISILTGIAIDRGFIKSVDQKVLDFFPDYTVLEGEKTIRDITLKNLLTMTAPYKYESEPYAQYFSSSDWVKAALDLLGGNKALGEFMYTPLIGPDILSGILVNATGQSVFDFAAENLFSPLGIRVEDNISFHSEAEQMAFLEAHNISGWAAGPSGVNTAGWGLTLTAVDMAKIGQLYLDSGKWNGKQIVPAGWVEESTKEQSRWREMNLNYGYLWWVETGSWFAAMGDSGNVIYVNTRAQTVISIASLYMEEAGDRMDLIKGYVEPILAGWTV